LLNFGVLLRPLLALIVLLVILALVWVGGYDQGYRMGRLDQLAEQSFLEGDEE
jgi:hypothetical protein